MELLQLQYFLAVARLEHVTEAAQSLHVTQSSLSRTIQRLEQDLGAPLFDRIGRKLQLNDLGSKFLRRAERALFELEQGRQEVRDDAGPQGGSIELAVTTASALPHILKRFRDERPDVRFHVQMLDTHAMKTLLQRGEVDFCLSSPPIQESDIESRVVHIDPLFVAVPKGHRLADRAGVFLAELKDEWFVGVKKGFGARDFVDSLCQAAGFVPQYVYEGDEPARLGSLVEAGIGIAFIPGTARNEREPIRYLRIEDHRLERRIALSWHRSRYLSRAALAFREVVESYFKSLSEAAAPPTA